MNKYPRIIFFLFALLALTMEMTAAPLKSDSTLCGFGNGYRNYAIEFRAGYAYNIAWSHHGNFEVKGLLPINPYFEAALRFQGSTANVYSLAANIRPKFDVKVGQVFIDMSLINRFVARAHQYDFAGSMALGWRMDYVSVEVGGMIRYQQFMDKTMSERGQTNVNPISLLYRMEIYCRPRTCDWNLWMEVGNINDFEIEHYTQPLFGIGAWYDITPHWRTTLSASFKPTGMFHMNAVFYGAGVQAGCRYTF